MQVSSSSALPAPLAASTNYYVRVTSSTTLSFHTTLTDAQNNSNPVDLTSAGSGTRTITPQDEGIHNGMTVTNVAGGVLTLGSGSGHSLPAAARPVTVECASGLFFLPDLRGRTAIGAGQGVGLTNRTPATLLGEEMHQLTVAEMPSHNHTSNPLIFNAGGGAYTGGSAGGSATLPVQGSDQPHNTMQPSVVTHYIIKA